MKIACSSLWVYTVDYSGAGLAVFTSSVSLRDSLPAHKILFSIVIQPNNNHTLFVTHLVPLLLFSVICLRISSTGPCLSAPAYRRSMQLLFHASTIIKQQLLAVGVNVSDTPARAVSVNYCCLYQSAQRITKASSVFRTAAAHSEHECSHMLLDGRKKGGKKEFISAPVTLTGSHF